MTATSGFYHYPAQPPLRRALSSDMYERKRLIAHYQETFSCRLAVMSDVIFDHSIPLFEDIIYDSQPEDNLHLILNSSGGDGEIAVRLARAAQARCSELTIIVPDQAKSAATLMALAADHILMGPASDLGPIDAQFWDGESLVSAKDVIATMDDAEARVLESPETLPLYASLLSDISGVMVQQARSALTRSRDLLREALSSCGTRPDAETKRLTDSLAEILIDRPASHAALFSADNAADSGLPIQKADIYGEQWKLIWQLWMKYWTLGQSVYESESASHILEGPELDA